jgi:hypothetical protein
MTTSASQPHPQFATTAVVLDPRTNGLRRSSNGGFAAGAFAAHVGGTAAVRLVARPPLGTPLTVTCADDGVVVTHRDAVIASARPAAPFVVHPPVVPSFEAAEAARHRHPFLGKRHALSDCVVCGPEREDGLHVTPGPLTGHAEVLATPFVPQAREAVAGIVRPEAVWGALDCPSYPATLMRRRRIALLGQLTAHPVRDLRVGEPLVVVGWTIHHGRRSHRTASAIVDENDQIVASARAVWVEVKHQLVVRLLSRFA